MSRYYRITRMISMVLALLSLVFLLFDAVVYRALQTKMTAFDEITRMEENLFIFTGVSLLVYLAFTLAAFLHTANYLRRAAELRFPYLVLLAGIVLSLLFVFSDLALLNDIGKQYREGWPQPEWFLLYPLLVFQFLTALVYLAFHLFAFRETELLPRVVVDSNVFLSVQYVGLICGFLGLLSAGLGYLFPRSWNYRIHTTGSMIVFMIPYGIAAFYWLFSKMKEKQGLLFDEKQRQDMGKASFWTLLVTTVVMVGLFAANYNNLGGITSVQWLPVWLFSVLFFFSVGNLYFGWRD